MNRFTGMGKIFIFLAFVFMFMGASGAHATITGAGAKGPTGSAFVNPLSPNQDGTNDFLNIYFANSGGSGHDYIIVIDTNRDGNADPITDWGSRTGKDWTWRNCVPSGGVTSVQWEGKDQDWRTVPNGTYQVWILEDYNSNI
jgi:hypothetical protein